MCWAWSWTSAWSPVLLSCGVKSIAYNLLGRRALETSRLREHWKFV
jgi:hypothetical protein